MHFSRANFKIMANNFKITLPYSTKKCNDQFQSLMSLEKDMLSA